MKGKKTRIIVWTTVGALVIGVGIFSYLIWSGKISSFAQMGPGGGGPGGPEPPTIRGQITRAANCNDNYDSYKVVFYKKPADGTYSWPYYGSASVSSTWNYSKKLPKGEYSIDVTSTCRPTMYGGSSFEPKGCGNDDGPRVTIVRDTPPPETADIKVKDPAMGLVFPVVDALTKKIISGALVQITDGCGYGGSFMTSSTQPIRAEICVSGQTTIKVTHEDYQDARAYHSPSANQACTVAPRYPDPEENAIQMRPK